MANVIDPASGFATGFTTDDPAVDALAATVPQAPEVADPGNPYAAMVAKAKPVEGTSYGDRFKANVEAGFDESIFGRVGAAGVAAQSRGSTSFIDEFGNTIPLPTSPEDAEKAREEHETERARYELMRGFDGPLEAAVALAGQVAGGMASPEAFITRLPGLTSLVERGAARVVAPVASRIAGAGATQGAVQAGTDAIGQAAEIAAGSRETYDPAETALKAGVGVVIGGALHGATEGVGAAVRARRLPDVDPVAADNYLAGRAVDTGTARARIDQVLAAEDPSFRSAADARIPEGTRVPEPAPVDAKVNSPAPPALAPLDKRIDALVPELAAVRSDYENRPVFAEDQERIALERATGVSVVDEQDAPSVRWALENGRRDIAEVLVERAERSAENLSVTPGVPEDSPKYAAIAADLARRKKESEQGAASLRAILDGADVAPGGLRSEVLDGPALPTTAEQPRPNGGPRPMPSREIAADLPSALADGPVDVKRFSTVPTVEELDRILAAGRAHDAAEADRIFGADAARARKLMRSTSARAHDDLADLVDKHGREAEGLVYGMHGKGVVIEDDLRSLRDALAHMDDAVAAAATAGKTDVLARELAWLAPKLPDIKAPDTAHTAAQRAAVLSLARATEDMQARGIDPTPVLKEAVEYTLRRTGGDDDDAKVLLSTLADYARRYIPLGDAAAPQPVAKQIAPPAGRQIGSAPAIPDRAAAAPVQFREKPSGRSEGSDGAGTATPDTTPVRSLHERALDLADDLGFPLRQGRLRSAKAAGQYDNQGVARVGAIPDFETVAHEAGHAIEAKVGPDLSALIQRHAGELGPMDYDAAKARPAEGFAEFVRQYLTAPAAAERAAPRFSAEFKAFMGERAPETLAKLDAAQGAHAAYIAAPSDVKLDAIVKTQEPDGLLKTLKEEGFARTVSLVVGRAYEAIFDDKAPVTRAVRDLARQYRDASGVRLSLQGSDNPENLVRMFARAQQAGIRDMMDGVRPYRSIVPEGPSLRDALIRATGDPGVFGRWDAPVMKEFSNYLVARRAEALWAKYDAGTLPNRPLAMTRADTADAIARIEAANATFREASDMVHGFTRELLRKQYEGGLIDRELFDQLQAETFYVPMYRVMRDKPLTAGGPTGGKRSEGPGKADLIKKIQGSDRDVVDPIQSLMTQAFLVNRTLAHNDIVKSMVALARRARAAGATDTGRILEEIPAKEIVGKRFDLAETMRAAAKQNGIDETDTKVLLGALTDVFGDDPIMGTIFRKEPTGARGEPITFWKEGGELRAVRLVSQEEGIGLYEAIASLPPQLGDMAMKFAAATSQALRLGITTNPTFAVTNFIRDQLAAMILRPDYIPFNPRGIVRELGQDGVAQLYNYAGGVSPGAGSAGLSELMNGHVDALARKGWAVQKLGGLSDLFTRNPLVGVPNAAKAIGEVVEVAEAGTRLNVMKQVFGQKKRQGLSDYDAMQEAAYQATDLMDFGRHGSGFVALRQLVPFLNAHLQGLDKARRVFVEPLLRAARGDLVSEAEVEAVRNSALAWAKMAGVGGALGYAYSLWASKHEAYRDANEELRATHFIIPGSAFGYDGNILVIPKPFELAIGFNLGEMLGQAATTGDPRVKEMALAGAQEIFLPPNPLSSIPLLKTYAELKLNRSFFTKREIVPESLQRLTPAEQYTTKTSSLAKWAGSTEIGKALGVSPVKVDYAIGSMFGMWGKDLLAASNSTDPNNPAAALEDAMFLRRFVKSADAGSETTKQFWQMAAQRNGTYAQAKATYEQMLGQFRDKDAADFLGALPTAERAFVVLNSAAGDNGKGKYTADEKRLHPLANAANAVQVINGYVRELQVNAAKEIASGERVAMDPQTRRQVIDNLRVLSAMEQRNAMVVTAQPGYRGRPLLSAADQLETIRAMAPKVADELATRYATGKILPAETLARLWPEAQGRLVKEGGQADLRDLAIDARAEGYALGGERVRKAPKRRVPIMAPAAP